MSGTAEDIEEFNQAITSKARQLGHDEALRASARRVLVEVILKALYAGTAPTINYMTPPPYWKIFGGSK